MFFNSVMVIDLFLQKTTILTALHEQEWARRPPGCYHGWQRAIRLPPRSQGVAPGWIAYARTGRASPLRWVDDVEPSIYDSRNQNIIQLRGPPNRGHSYYKVGPGVHARRPLRHPGSGEPALGFRWYFQKTMFIITYPGCNDNFHFYLVKRALLSSQR